MYVFRVEPLLVKMRIVIHACSPSTSESPASNYWGIDQSVHYGSGTKKTTILATTAGIVDTGKWKLSYNILADGSKVIYHFRNHSCPSCHGWIQQVQGSYRGCCRQCDWTASHYQHPILGFEGSVLHSWWCTYIPSSLSTNILINFNLLLLFSHLQTTFELTPDAQIWPRALNTQVGGTAGNIYLIVSDLGTPSGQGLDFINGMAFLERFYAVYDTANKRVGLATTPFTYATFN